MDTAKFTGTGVAIVTPFKNGEIDYDALAVLIDHCVNGGVDYIVSLGTTGESVTLSPDEERSVLNFTIQTLNNRIPLVAGNFGGNNTAALVQKIQAYDFSGISAILSSSPAYNKPSQEGIFRHYKALSEVSSEPIILYNVPGRTASNITGDTTLRIARECDNVIGIKEASGDMAQAGHVAKYRQDDFLLISGDDPTAMELIACGGNGVISVIANALPSAFSTLISSAIDGDFKKAREIHLALLDIHPLLYVEGNPVGIKAALEILGLTSDEVRLPLVSMSSGQKQKLEKAIGELEDSLRG